MKKRNEKVKSSDNYLALEINWDITMKHKQRIQIEVVVVVSIEGGTVLQYSNGPGNE